MLAAEALAELCPALARDRSDRHDTPLAAGLHTKRISLGQLLALPFRCALQRLQGMGFIIVEHGIELLWQPGMEIVAAPLGFGAINDADGALEVRFAQCRAHTLIVAECQQE